jgi:hypothetical protein
MLQLIKIATLSAALSAGIVTAYGGARTEAQRGTKAFYDRLASGRRSGRGRPRAPPRAFEPAGVSGSMRKLYETAVLGAAACFGLGAAFVINPLLPF